VDYLPDPISLSVAYILIGQRNEKKERDRNFFPSQVGNQPTDLNQN